MKLVKICDVKNIYEARTLGEFGVNFVGLHYVSVNDKARSEDLKMIIRLYHQDHPRTKSILVTKEKDINSLIALVNEFECDGLQLHYAASPSLLAKLRLHFGARLLLFGVVAPDQLMALEAAAFTDYIIADKSYLGGTGTRLTAQERTHLISRYKGKKILLAGGVNASLIKEVGEYEGVAGFDIQSAVKGNHGDVYENISLSRLTVVLKALGREKATPALGQVGFSSMGSEELTEYYGACDFWHFDFFDDIFGLNTNDERMLQEVIWHSKVNSHFRFQIHIFSSHPAYVKKIINTIKDIQVKTLEFYAHHNAQTIRSYRLIDEVYASLDTKDIISGDFPLKKALSRDKMILCLQSERHSERSATANTVMKIIQELWRKDMTITLDRGIFPGDLNYVLEQQVDIVSGRYLHKHKKDGYAELRRSLNNVK